MMKKMRKIFGTGLMLSVLFLMTACTGVKESKQELFSRSGFYFDTNITIKVYDEQGEALLKKCFSLCNELEHIFSRTLQDSELYQVNHRVSDEVVISDHLAAVIALGLEYGEKTGGAFDITICPVADLWDFKSENPGVPAQEDIVAAVKKVDYRKVHLSDNTLTFDSKNTMIDLGAIAKGYAADQIKELLLEEGVESAVINLGGNVQTIGSKPDGKPWYVGIQKPFSPSGEILTVVEVADQSVVSTGTYERYFELDGVKYHHVLNPKTGYPVMADLDQITIVCEQSALADVLSTSCLLIEEEQAKVLLEDVGFSNTWLHLDDRCAMIRQVTEMN